MHTNFDWITVIFARIYLGLVFILFNMEVDEENYTDSVMNRDNLPIPVNTPAKQASPIPFSLTPSVLTKTLENRPKSKEDEASASGQTNSSKPFQFVSVEPVPDKRKRDDNSPESIVPTQQPKMTPSMVITDEERAEFKKLDTPKWGEKLLESLTTRMSVLQSSIDTKCSSVKTECLRKINNVQEQLDQVEIQTHENSIDISIMREQLEEQGRLLAQVDANGRCHTLIFSGFKENKKETKSDLVSLIRAQLAKIDNEDILKEHPKIKDAQFYHVHRDGRWKPDQKRPRDVKVTFKDYEERSAILAGKKSFDANIFVNADLPQEWSYAQRALKPIVKLTEGTPFAGKNKFGKPRVTCIAGVLKVDNKKYGLHNLDTLPEGINFWSNNIRSTLTLLVWFGLLSPFSNFFYAPMFLRKKYFKWAEQFIQYAKAIMFGDEFTARRILLAKDPYECKRLAYKIKGFDQDEWDKAAPKICDEALRGKVDQNEFVRKFLVEQTGNKVLAEAAVDSKWACGLALHDDNILHRRNWLRIGHGGLTLMKIRSELTGLPMPDLDLESSDEDS